MIPIVTEFRSELERQFMAWALHNAIPGEGVAHSILYEPITLRLAPNTTYTPDFLLVTTMRFVVVEVKGRPRDASQVKLKCAAAKFPWFAFYKARKVRNEWDFTHIRSET